MVNEKEVAEITKIIEDDKGIVSYEVKKKVAKIGDGAHVMIPKELIGVVVDIKQLSIMNGQYIIFESVEIFVVMNILYYGLCFILN